MTVFVADLNGPGACNVIAGEVVPRLPKLISGSLAAEPEFPPIIVPNASNDAALNVTPD